MKNKFSFLFFLCLFVCVGNLFASDFKESFYFNELELSINAEKKYIDGTNVYVKSYSGLTGVRRQNIFYTVLEVITPRIVDNRYIYEMAVRNNITGNITRLSISGNIYFDYNGPVLNTSYSSKSLKKYKNQKNKFFSKDDLKVKFSYQDEHNLPVSEVWYKIGDKNEFYSSGKLAASDSYSFDFSDEGIYTVDAYATDVLENKSKLTKETFIIDRTAPVFENLSQFVNKNWQKSYKKFIFNAKDERSGINSSSYKYSLNSSGKEFFSGNKIDIENDGFYNIQVFAEDFAGNQVASEIYDLKFDATSPQIICSFDEKDWNQNYKFSISFEDNLSGIKNKWASLDGKTLANPEILEIKEDGNYKFEIFAEDEAGNVCNKKIDLKIDGTKPFVEDFSGISEDQKFYVKCADNLSGVNSESFRWKIDGKDWKKGNYVELEEGEQDISFYAEDNAKNSVLVTKKVYFSSKTPTINFSLADFENTNILKLDSFEILCEHFKQLEVKFFIDEKEIEPFENENKNYAFNIEDFADGKHCFKIFCNAGKNRSSFGEKEFFIDRVKPEIQYLDILNYGNKICSKDFLKLESSESSSELLKTDLYLKIGEKEISENESKVKYFYRFNSDDWKEASGCEIKIFDCIEGKNQLDVKAVDEASNESEIKKNIFFVDTEIFEEPKISEILKNKNSVFIKVISGKTSRFGLDKIVLEYIPADKNLTEKISEELGNSLEENKSFTEKIFDELKCESLVLKADSENEFLVKNLNFDDTEKNYIFRIFAQNKSGLSGNKIYYILKNDGVFLSSAGNFEILTWNKNINNFSGELLRFEKDSTSEELLNENEISCLENNEAYFDKTENSGTYIKFEAYKNDESENQNTFEFLAEKENSSEINQQEEIVNLTINPEEIEINESFIKIPKFYESASNLIQDEIIVKVYGNNFLPEILCFKKDDELVIYKDFFEQIKYFTDAENNENNENQKDENLCLEIILYGKEKEKFSTQLLFNIADGKIANFSSQEEDFTKTAENNFANFSIKYDEKISFNSECQEYSNFTKNFEIDFFKSLTFYDNLKNENYEKLNFNANCENAFYLNQCAKNPSENICGDFFVPENFAIRICDFDLLKISPDNLISYAQKKILTEKGKLNLGKNIFSYRNLIFNLNDFVRLNSENLIFDSSSEKFLADYFDFSFCSLDEADEKSETENLKFSLKDNVLFSESKMFLHPKNFCIYEDSACENKIQEIEVDEAKFDLNGNLLYSKNFDKEFFVNLGSEISTAKNFLFIKEFILIKELLFKTSIADTEIFISIENLKFDDKNKVFDSSNSEISVFDKDKNLLSEIYFNGIKIDFSGIQIGSDGKILCSGEVQINENKINLENIEITNDGFNTKNVSLEKINLNLYGFDFIVESAELVKENNSLKLNLKNAFCDFYGNKIDVSGLEVFYENNFFVKSEFSVKNSFSTDFGFGSDIEVNKFKINKNGIFADCKVLFENQIFEFKKVCFNDREICAEKNLSQLNIFNCKVSVDKIIFSGNSLCVKEAALKSKKMKFEFLFNEIFFNQEKIISYSLSEIKTSNAKFNNWNLEIENFAWTRDFYFSGSIYGELSERGNNGAPIFCNMQFENFYLDDNETVNLKNATYTSESFIYKDDYEIYLLEPEYNQQKNSFSSEKNMFYTDHNSGIELGKIEFSKKEFSAEPLENQSLSLKLRNSLSQLNIKSSEFDSKIKISAVCSDSKIKFKTLEEAKIYVSQYGYFKIQDENILCEFYIGGNKIFAYLKNLNNNLIELSNAYLILENQKIELGDFTFDKNWNLISNVKKAQSQEIFVQGRKFNLLKTEVKKSGIFFKLETLDACLFDQTFIFDEVEVLENSFLRFTRLLEDYEYKGNAFEVSARSVSYQNSKIVFNRLKLKIKLYEQDINIFINNFSIDENGEFFLQCAGVDPFDLCGMNVCVDSFSMCKEYFLFSGTVSLPYELPGILGGLNFEVQNIKIIFGKGIENFDFKIDCDYTVTLFGEWNINFKTIRYKFYENKASLCLDSCSLLFPEKLDINELKLNSLNIDLQNMEISFDEISAQTEFNFNLFGIDFLVNKIFFSSNYEFGFLGSVVFSDEKFPEVLKNTKFEDISISFDSKGQIKDFEISAKNIHGKIFKENPYLYVNDGLLSFEKENDDYFLNLSGFIEFWNESSELFKNINLRLGIKELKFNLTKNELVSFFAGADNINFNLGGAEFSELSAYFEYTNTAPNYVLLSGNLILPEYLPQALAGTIIKLEDFKISESGEIQSLFVNYECAEKISIINGIFAENLALNFNFQNNDYYFLLSGEVGFSDEVFPEFISEIRTQGKFIFNQNGLDSCFVKSSLLQTELFDAFYAEKLELELVKEFASEAYIFLSGEIYLLNQKDLKFDESKFCIDEFLITSSGEILNFKCTSSSKEITVYDHIKISNSKLQLEYEDNDFVLLCAGNVQFANSKIPDEIKNAQLKIKNFEYSLTSGLKDFDVEAKNLICLNLNKNIQIDFDSLSLNKTGIYFSCGANLMNLDFIKNLKISFNNIFYSWDGKISNAECSLKNVNLEFMKFGCNLEEFKIYQNKKNNFCIEMKNISLLTTSDFSQYGINSLHIEKISVENNQISCDFSTEKISLNICGFELLLENMDLDFEKQNIYFKKAKLKLPELLSNACVSLDSISYNKISGLNISQFEFMLPEFSIGKNIAFRKIYAGFKKTGEVFEIKGNGFVSVPNLGELAVLVSFTNDFNNYLLGIKTAYFSFESSGLGLPLGMTGLYVNGVRGGISYGLDENISEKIRSKFTDGMTLQLGVSIKDKTSQLVQIKSDLWIDVQNLSFAINGEMSVLKGSFNLSGNAQAVLSKYGFSANMKVDILFVKGKIELNIFSLDGNLKFSGSAQIQICVKRGQAYFSRNNFFGITVEIALPPGDLYFPSLSAEFGDFNNNERGFKTSVNIGGIGELGVFVSASGVQLKNVSNIQLVKNPLANKLKAKKELALIDSELDEDFVETDSIKNKKLNSISFICAYQDICPEFTFVSPSNEKFESKNLDCYFGENYRIFIIENVDDGDWTYFTESDASSYSVDIIKNYKKDIPQTKFIRADNDSDSIELSGKFVENAAVEILYSEADENQYFVLDSFLCETDGTYSEKISSKKLPDSYYKFALRSSEYFSDDTKIEYIDEILKIEHKNKIISLPEKISVVLEKNYYRIFWKQENFSFADNYIIEYYFDGKSSEATKLNLGFVNEFLINSQNSKSLSFRIMAACEDSASAFSEWLTYTLNENPKKLNLKFPETVSCKRNDSANFKIDILDELDVEQEFFSQTLKIENEFGVETENISILLDAEKSSSKKMKFTVYANSECESGIYYATLKINSLNNQNYENEVKLKLEISESDLIVKNFFPSTLESSTKELEIFGNGFCEGTKYFLNGNEISILENSSLMQVCLSIENANLNYSGKNELRIERSFGDFTVIEIPGETKEMNLIPFYAELSVERGKSYSIPIIVENYNFNDQIEFAANSENIYVSSEKISCDCITEIQIFINENFSGTDAFVHILKNGEIHNSIKLKIEDKNLNLAPEILNSSKYNAYCGDEIELYGKNFTVDSVLLLNETKIDFELLSNNKLKFKVKSSMKSGNLYVRNFSEKSNSIKLSIFDLSPSFKIKDKKIIFTENETKEIFVTCANITETTLIECSSSNVNFDISQKKIFSDTLLSIKLNLKNPQILEDDEVKIKFSSKNYKNQISLTVQNFCVPEILCDEKLEFDFGSFVNYKIGTSALSKKNYQFSLESGFLPSGLELTSDGKILGYAKETGSFDFCVKLFCENISVSKKLNISVIETVFNSSLSGTNNFIDEKFPNEKNILYSEILYDKYERLFIFDKRIYLQNENSIFIKNCDGQNINKLTYEKKIEKILVSKNYLFVFFEDSNLLVLNKNNFRQIQNFYVKNFFAVRNYVYLIFDDLIKIYDTEDFLLKAQQKHNFANIKNVLELNSKNYIFTENEIFDEKLKSVFKIENEKIKKCISFEQNIFILCENFLYVLNSDFIFEEKFDLKEFDSVNDFAISSDFILLKNDENLFCCRRVDKKIQCSFSDIEDFCLCSNNLILKKTSGELASFNLYSGNKICSFENSCNAFSLFSKKIFLLSSNNQLVKISGENNLFGPELILSLPENIGTKVFDKNSEPIQKNWICENFDFNLCAEDKETFSKQIFYSLNDSDFLPYENKIDFEEGLNEIKFFAVDSENKNGNTVSVSFYYDSLAPSSKMLDLKNQSEWLDKKTVIKFSAEDETSGVKKIVLNNKKLSRNSVLVDKEGSNEFYWYSEDFAGNKENLQHCVVKIDYSKPEVFVDLTENSDAFEIKFRAYDKGSGVKEIEYSFDNSEIKKCAADEKIFIKKFSVLKYRALDFSGKYSDWKYFYSKVNLFRYKNFTVSLNGNKINSYNDNFSQSRVQNFGAYSDFMTYELKEKFKNLKVLKLPNLFVKRRKNILRFENFENKNIVILSFDEIVNDKVILQESLFCKEKKIYVYKIDSAIAGDFELSFDKTKNLPLILLE